MTTTIFEIAEDILVDHFFYDQEGIDIFLCGFAKIVNGEHATLTLMANEEFKTFIAENRDAKLKFSANFLGFHLFKTLGEIMNFSLQEISFFETLFLKYLKEVEPFEHAKKYERTND